MRERLRRVHRTLRRRFWWGVLKCAEALGRGAHGLGWYASERLVR